MSRSQINKELNVSAGFVTDANNQDIVYRVNDRQQFDRWKPETEVRIYADVVKGWFIDVADHLRSHDEAEFVQMQIALSQVEGFMQIYEGLNDKEAIGDSGRLFQDGITLVTGYTDMKAIATLWKSARCGAFHTGFVRRQILLNRQLPTCFERTGDLVRINPDKFCERVHRHLQEYMDDLRNSRFRRINFAKTWLHRWDELTPVRIDAFRDAALPQIAV